MTFGSVTLAAAPTDSASAEVDGRSAAVAYDSCTAEIAECSCPDFCERDHDVD